MSAIGKAIGPLVNIALLLLFAIIIFAIIGLEFYAGALNKTCYDLSDLNRIVQESEAGSPCHEGTHEKAPIGSYTCNANDSICIGMSKTVPLLWLWLEANWLIAINYRKMGGSQ